MDKFHAEAPRLHHVAGLVGHQLYLVVQPVLLQLQLNQPVGHGSTVDGADYLLHKIRNGANVVLVPMGDKHPPELLGICNDIGKIGNHQVNAVHILVRKANAAIDDNHILAILQHGHVLANLIQTAKRDNL